MSEFTEECLAIGSPWIGQEPDLIWDKNSRLEHIQRRDSMRSIGQRAVGPTEADLIVAGDDTLFGTLFENAAALAELKKMRAERAAEFASEQ